MALDESFIFDIDVQIINEESLTALRSELKKSREEYLRLKKALRETSREGLTAAQSQVNSSRKSREAIKSEILVARDKVRSDRKREISSKKFSQSSPKEVAAVNRRVTALRANIEVQKRLNKEKVAAAQIAKFQSIGRQDLITDPLRKTAGQRTLADVNREVSEKKKAAEQTSRFRIKKEEEVARAQASLRKQQIREEKALAKERERQHNAQIKQEARIARDRERDTAKALRLEEKLNLEKERARKFKVREQNRLFGDDSTQTVQKQDRAKRTIDALRRQGREDLITNSLRTQSGELKKQEGLAQRLLFTFRRLVGVLALFTLARVVTREFANMVRFGIQFADSIKGSEIAIGGIVTASTRLSDEFGNILTGVDALNAAQGLARDQLGKLRQDALKTTATFEELAETFQIAVGPGLSAGGTLDEIRELTVGISQAATAIGLPQNQLAEEIRSLLSGTIQARTTRIATTLGITNSDIKQLKEAGTLFAVLNKRFDAFQESAERAARSTISGLQTLLRGAFGEVLAQASDGLRGILLTQLTELLDGVLLVKDEVGNVAPNPQAVAVFRTVFDFLGEIIIRAKAAASILTFTDVIRSLRFVQAILRNVIAFAEGFASVIAVGFQLLVSLFSTFRDTLGASTQEALRFLGVFIALRVLIPGVIGEFVKIAGVITKINKTTLIWLGIAIALGKALQFVTQKVTGVNVSLTDTVKLIGLGLSVALNDVGGAFAKMGAIIKANLLGPLEKAEFLSRKVALAAKLAKAGATGDDTEQQRLFQEKDALDLESERAAKERGLSLDQKLARITAETKKREIELGNRVSILLGDNRTQVEKNTEAMGDLDKVLGSVKSAFEDTFGSTGAGLALSSATEIIRDLAAPMSELRTSTQDANREFLKMASTIRTLEGTGGGAFIEIFDQGSLATGKKLEASLRALVDLRKQLKGENGTTADSRAKILSLQKDILDVEDARLQISLQQTQISNAQAATAALKLADELRGTAELARINSQFALQDSLAPTNAKRNEVQATKDLAIALQTARQEDQKRAQSIALLSTLAEGFNGRQKQAVLDLIELEKERKGVEEQAFRARISRLEEEAARATALASDDLSAGIGVGLKQIVEELPTLAQTGADLIKQTVNGLGDFISTTIVDAFDPTKDNTIRERFASFVAGLAQTLISAFAKVQLAKLFPTLLGAAGGATGGQVAGGARGGFVTGFDGGGIVPSTAPSIGSQPGFDPRDVVPALLRKNEFVVRPEIARPNMEFLHALNSGQFLPHLLRSGMKTKGFATGGATSGGSSTVTSPGSGAGLVVLPAIAADEETMDRMTSGGQAAFMQFATDNAAELNAILGNS